MNDKSILINNTAPYKPIKLSLFHVLSSGSIIVYIWSLPYLSYIGFAEPVGNSISEFIANAHATGALASLSFTPLTLMWEYQDFRVINVCSQKGKIILYSTLVAYQFFYAGFLVCTVNYAPIWLHTTTVTLFCIAFVFHSVMTMYYTQPSLFGQLELIIGILACACMPFAQGLWFWVCECIGYSMIMLFTPTELLLNYE